jgi:hypothetical protein
MKLSVSQCFNLMRQRTLSRSPFLRLHLISSVLLRTPCISDGVTNLETGFTLGWNYWYQFAIGVPIEV